MSQIVRVDEVFSLENVPRLAFVDREKVSDDKLTIAQVKSIRSAICQGGKTPLIFGDSKSGKSIYCKALLKRSGFDFHVLSAGTFINADSFWQAIAQELALSMPVQRMQLDHRQEGVENRFGGSATTEGRGGIRGFFEIGGTVAGEAGLQKASETGVQNEVTEVPLISPRQICLNALRTSKRLAFLVEDFHNITDDTLRATVLLQIKEVVEAGLCKFVILAIPENTYAMARSDEQLLDRFDVLPFPGWNETELGAIVSQGFKTLGLELPPEQIRKISKTASSSPANVQEICWNILFDANITSTDEISPDFEVTQDMIEGAIRTFARRYIYLEEIIAQALTAGSESAKSRLYDVAGQKLNIYEIVLLTLCSVPIVANAELGVTKKRILEKIRLLTKRPDWNHPAFDRVLEALASTRIDRTIIRSGQVTESLTPFLYRRASPNGVPPQDKLYIVEPALKVFLLWYYAESRGLDRDTIDSLLKN